ncbi:MAG: riboflavin biosynthesis protein RibD [Candidatus Omnitrophica bacterium CG11_big_fil_rev_8_21_14_0_20_42_13]|uniref:Riboflavin biosynthesis protein RibD n=1 Tax=Candidatus Ghiorseimicrobium undicola TaxID=1974746 RepID=A0A2H0LWM8_9BACT|nr:MAG: riboflavin biosynthesis protein RibD [Candidatus Omnitrophica bacterium CG11_big_fil_rev_8_21_14_0_20_42_13]
MLNPVKKGPDSFYMRKALSLALKAKDPRPNPYVGAVVVKNNKIIATGFHKKTGAAHAEIVALNKAAGRVQGATLYITLEPCSHFGRTPPCTDKIIESGVKEVIVGMRDPNPLNNGKGINLLRRAGIKVKTGIRQTECRKMNKVFMKYTRQKMPYICVKAGQSLDGKIATRNFNSQWITGKPARDFSHKLRSNFDAIMVGVNTILKDNPRLSGTSKNIKIIADTKLKIPINSNIFIDGKIIIVTAKKITDNKAVKLIKKGAQVITVERKSGKVHLRQMMRELAALEISKILVEGGGELIGSLFDEKLVDYAMFFTAPKIIGGKNAVSSVSGKGVGGIDEVIKLNNIETKKIGEDLLIEGDVKFLPA